MRATCSPSRSTTNSMFCSGRARMYGERYRPATTLAVVQQLAFPEILVEIEVVAARAPA